MSQQVMYKAESRGHANHGWLDSYHTFSFAGYYDPNRIHFGNLRVLNDDYIMAGRGFGRHPHDNMEIISIPLSGQLKHEDSMGNGSIIEHGEVQVMSAGTGVQHSEFNPNAKEAVNLLQIWVFPRAMNLQPRYGQVKYTFEQNKFTQIVSPNPAENETWINQDAWFNLGTFDKDHREAYNIHKEGNGLYAFVLEGSANIDNTVLQRRDAVGITATNQIDITILEPNTKILLLEVPMQLADFLVG